jgi:hypothetical protein
MSKDMSLMLSNLGDKASFFSWVLMNLSVFYTELGIRSATSF